MTITERLLRAKHWQLFLLTIGIPIILQIIMMVTMFASFGNDAEPDPTMFFSFLSVFPIIIIVSNGTLFGWFWAIATGLQDKIPSNIKLKTGRFKVFFFIPMVYILFILLGISAAAAWPPDMAGHGEEPNVALIASSVSIILPLHFFSMFCIFYCLYFVAKTLKTVELQRETTFSDFAGEFFIIWFYPIGIWIVQPRINKIVDPTSIRS